MKIWSNLFFLVPLLIAAYLGLNLYVAVVGITFLISLLYHMREEDKLLYYADVLFSGILMLANFLLLFMSGWRLPWSAGAVIFAALAIWSYTSKFKKGDSFRHSLWHIFSAGVSLFCLLSVI